MKKKVAAAVVAESMDGKVWQPEGKRHIFFSGEGIASPGVDSRRGRSPPFSPDSCTGRRPTNGPVKNENLPLLRSREFV